MSNMNVYMNTFLSREKLKSSFHCQRPRFVYKNKWLMNKILAIETYTKIDFIRRRILSGQVEIYK